MSFHFTKEAAENECHVNRRKEITEIAETRENHEAMIHHHHQLVHW